VEPWSSEGVRLCNFKIILRALRYYQAELGIAAPLIDVCLEA
jgi:hypothetical protein